MFGFDALKDYDPAMEESEAVSRYAELLETITKQAEQIQQSLRDSQSALLVSGQRRQFLTVKPVINDKGSATYIIQEQRGPHYANYWLSEYRLNMVTNVDAYTTLIKEIRDHLNATFRSMGATATIANRAVPSGQWGEITSAGPRSIDDQRKILNSQIALSEEEVIIQPPLWQATDFTYENHYEKRILELEEKAAMESIKKTIEEQ